MKLLLFRVGGFAFLPLFSAVAPLLLLPIISRIGGVDGWASVMTGQALGAFGAIVVSFGWNLAGPPRVAKLGVGAASRHVYAVSIRSRLLVFIIVTPPISSLSAMLSAPDYIADATMMTIAMTFFGLSPGWYAIGIGRPSFLAVYEAIPKLVATGLAAVLLIMGMSIWTYPMLLLVASAFGVLAFHQRQMGSWWPKPQTGAARSEWPLKSMRLPALVDITGATYASSALPIVSSTSGILVTSTFASADKLYRYGMFGISALANALQAWVLDRSSHRPIRRHLAAIFAHLFLGGLGFTFLVIAGPLATELLFGATVAAAAPVCTGFGAAYFFLSASTPLIRNLLLPNGRASVILRATILSALVGVSAMFLGAIAWGGPGAAFGLALSELLILLAILPEAFRQLRRIRWPQA